MVAGLPATNGGGSLTLATGDDNTSRGAVTIDGGDGTTALGGSITVFIGWGHGHKQHCNSQWAPVTVREMHSVSRLAILWEPLQKLP